MYTQNWVIWKFYVYFLKKLSYCFSQLKYVSSFNGKKEALIVCHLGNVDQIVLRASAFLHIFNSGAMTPFSFSC